jgi:HSP20 family protein
MTRASRGAELEVARIQSEINRLFEMLLRLRNGPEGGGSWTPAVDVAETDSHLIVEAEIPGVDASALDVWAHGGNLYLQGERREPEEPRGDGAEILHDERDFGRFELTVPLTAAVNPREAVASVSRGVLRIDLPKVANRRGVKVHIPVGARAPEGTERGAAE